MWGKAFFFFFFLLVALVESISVPLRTNGNLSAFIYWKQHNNHAIEIFIQGAFGNNFLI